ncbi:MAG: LysR family transcriptional regulator [Pseudomonadota bacterium]
MKGLPSHQFLRRLAYFAAIAEAGSVRGGAARLGLSIAVMSSALTELEAELGVTLANRSTRTFRLTRAGEEVCAIAAEVLATASRAFRFQSEGAAPSGRVKVSLPVELATHWLPARLASFYAAHPDITCDVEADDQVLDLSKTDIDLGIRALFRAPTLEDSEHGDLALVFVVAPSATIETSDPTAWHLNCPLLLNPHETDVTALDRTRGHRVRMLSDRTMRLNSKEAAIALARNGLGAVRAIRLAVQPDLNAGRLVEVAPGLEIGSLTLTGVLRDERPDPCALALADGLLGPKEHGLLADHHVASIGE